MGQSNISLRLWCEDVRPTGHGGALLYRTLLLSYSDIHYQTLFKRGVFSLNLLNL
jgi:hypothetical protein